VEKDKPTQQTNEEITKEIKFLFEKWDKTGCGGLVGGPEATHKGRRASHTRQLAAQNTDREKRERR
jgi:hypothetical protein